MEGRSRAYDSDHKIFSAYLCLVEALECGLLTIERTIAIVRLQKAGIEEFGEVCQGIRGQSLLLTRLLEPVYSDRTGSQNETNRSNQDDVHE